jgi:hypothetical protein
MRLRSPASLPERSGRARGGRASPGALIVLPFRRRLTCPARPFSTRPKAGGPCFGPYRITPRPLLAATCSGHDFRRRPAQLARGEQAQAIHRRPQGPPRYPSPGLHRSTTARRHRGAGSDALPTDGMDRSLARVPAMMAADADFLRRIVESVGWRAGAC